MPCLHRSRFRLASLAFLLVSVLAGPLARQAAAQFASIDPLVDPVAASRAWDETSGYGALEASRAGIIDLPATDPDAMTWRNAPVDPRRLQSALVALDSRDLGGMQEAAMADVVDQFMTRDRTSGYGALEASRAGLACDLEP